MYYVLFIYLSTTNINRVYMSYIFDEECVCCKFKKLAVTIIIIMINMPSTLAQQTRGFYF